MRSWRPRTSRRLCTKNPATMAPPKTCRDARLRGPILHSAQRPLSVNALLFYRHSRSATECPQHWLNLRVTIPGRFAVSDVFQVLLSSSNPIIEVIHGYGLPSAHRRFSNTPRQRRTCFLSRLSSPTRLLLRGGARLH